MNEVLKMTTTRYPDLEACIPVIEAAFELMRVSFSQGGKLLLCGNGGSAADCEHVVGELMKGFMSKRPLQASTIERFESEFPGEGTSIATKLQGALPAISLVSHSSFLTAYANDVASEMIFAQQVYGYGRPGDVLIGFSTSGNSVNVLRALQVAKLQGMKTIGFTGFNGGKMRALCDVSICVPSERTPHIQERHLPIYHALCIMLEEVFFPS
ncbi:SIS domain-containing protein [Paenibacillus sp. GCM10023248]|uniref:D-sedoheptulose-7-phosphate isomerase n=1 Tax=Bacillales TaxID=1385 RepID=UPI002379FD91|nr:MULTISPECIES: SIS domain-containing protein [Bacillales]MDD9269568.1 SIS domain-containing protein [Paenibacillus sp. MAHUQ-63]MDR6880801.1 D-sedoheptulose 7-phosphate isomerase [Bacillus sp. 3255]